MMAVELHLACVFLLYLLNGVQCAAFPRALGSDKPSEKIKPLGRESNRYGNSPLLRDLRPFRKAPADGQAQLWSQMEALQKPQRSSAGVSGEAQNRAPPGLHSPSQYRPMAYFFSKLPQGRVSPRPSRPAQHGSRLHATLKASPEGFPQRGPPPAQLKPQAKPRTFEFSIKVPFVKGEDDGTTKESDPASGDGWADAFRPSSIQIHTSFNNPGPQKGSSKNGSNVVNPSMLNYQLNLEVPIPAQSSSTRRLSGVGENSGMKGALSPPGNPSPNSPGVGQKGPWTQNKPTADLYTLSVPEKPQSGSNPLNTGPESFPTAQLQPEPLLPFTNEYQLPPQSHPPNIIYYRPDPSNNMPTSGSSHSLPKPISRPQGHTDLTKSEILTQITKGHHINQFPYQRPTYVNRLNNYYNSQLKPKPATYDDGQSGHASSSGLTSMYDQIPPPSVPVPYDKTQRVLNSLPLTPAGEDYSKGQNQQTVSQIAASEQGNDGQFKPQFSGAGQYEDALHPIDRGYDLYPSLAPSQYQQVSRPIWNPGTVHQGKNNAIVEDSRQIIFKPPTPASDSSLYEFDTDQTEQTLNGHFSAVERQPPPLIRYTGTGQMDGQAPFTEPVKESDSSWTSDGSTRYPDYVSNPLNLPSRKWPLHTGYSTEQQGIVQNRPSTSAFETYQLNPLESDYSAPVYNTLPTQTNQDLLDSAYSEAAHYVPDPGDYGPVEASSGSSTLVPLKPISEPQWEATALNKGNAAEKNPMYNYNQYDRLDDVNPGRVAQPQIPFKTSDDEDDFQEGKSQVYPPQDVSNTVNVNGPQMFPVGQQTSSAFSNEEPALALHEATPVDNGPTWPVDRRPPPHYRLQSALDTLPSSWYPLDRDGADGDVDPFHRKQVPQYTLPLQSSPRKPAHQNRQGAENGFKVMPDLGSHGYSSSGGEIAPLRERVSTTGEHGRWPPQTGPQQSVHRDLNLGYELSVSQGSQSEIPSSTNRHLTLMPRDDCNQWAIETGQGCSRTHGLWR